MDISTSEITPIKVCGNKADFSTIEITPKKLRGNDVDFWTLKITFKKVGGNEMDFSISKIISKKYAQMMWKFVEIGLRRIDVISMWNRDRFDVVCTLDYKFLKN